MLWPRWLLRGARVGAGAYASRRSATPPTAPRASRTRCCRSTGEPACRRRSATRPRPSSTSATPATGAGPTPLPLTDRFTGEVVALAATDLTDFALLTTPASSTSPAPPYSPPKPAAPSDPSSPSWRPMSPTSPPKPLPNRPSADASATSRHWAGVRGSDARSVRCRRALSAEPQLPPLESAVDPWSGRYLFRISAPAGSMAATACRGWCSTAALVADRPPAR